MGNARFVFACGRKVTLYRLDMCFTYEGLLEGALDSFSRHIRRDMPKQVRALFRIPTGEELPLAMNDEDEDELPYHHWHTYFWSPARESGADDGTPTGRAAGGDDVTSLLRRVASALEAKQPPPIGLYPESRAALAPKARDPRGSFRSPCLSIHPRHPS